MDIIKETEDIALSNFDLTKMLDGEANIILYPNLANFNSVDEILGPYGACIILFESQPRYGHWVCLMRRDNTIEFFNPYGGLPDASLQKIPLEYRIESGQDYPLLTLILYHSPYDVEYNEFKFQRHGQNIRTCGRWCVVRLLLKDLDIYQFKDFIDAGKTDLGLNGDQFVSLLTCNKIDLK